MSPDTDRASFDLRLDQCIYSLSEDGSAEFSANFQLLVKYLRGIVFKVILTLCVVPFFYFLEN